MVFSFFFCLLLFSLLCHPEHYCALNSIFFQASASVCASSFVCASSERASERIFLQLISNKEIKISIFFPHEQREDNNVSRKHVKMCSIKNIHYNLIFNKTKKKNKKKKNTIGGIYKF